MRILIATTAAAPKDFELMCASLRQAAQSTNIVIEPGILWTYGSWCYNVTMDLTGSDYDSEKFANSLITALMPAKWCTTMDDLPSVDTCNTPEVVR